MRARPRRHHARWVAGRRSAAGTSHANGLALGAVGLLVVGLGLLLWLSDDAPAPDRRPVTETSRPPTTAPTTALTTPPTTPSPTAGSATPSISPSPSSSDPPVSGGIEGTWAGPGLTLTVHRTGATAEFDCATGAITEPLRPDPDGRFLHDGWWAASAGGPAGPGEPSPKRQQARWRGDVNGDRLEVRVDLESGTVLGPFQLARGAPPELDQCV